MAEKGVTPLWLSDGFCLTQIHGPWFSFELQSHAAFSRTLKLWNYSLVLFLPPPGHILLCCLLPQHPTPTFTSSPLASWHSGAGTSPLIALAQAGDEEAVTGRSMALGWARYSHWVVHSGSRMAFPVDSSRPLPLPLHPQPVPSLVAMKR